MNKTIINHLITVLFVIFAMAFGPAVAVQQVQAQDAGNPADSEKFSREELAQMLGPIALYPDKLLSQILMASTYPLEVIEADRWTRKNPGLQGDPLDRALLDQNWDPSVKALCHFPSILALMSERIGETTNLGNAFLVQEAEVMDMVQELRNKAYAQGNLVTNSRQQVIVEKETIIIEPTNSRVVYVPYYDPYYIYGPWWYPAYRPYYWGPPGVSLGWAISYWPGIYFSYSWGNWGYFNWPHRHVFINIHERPRYVKHNHWYAKSGRWVHAPVHRRGVAYRDKSTATKYGQYSQRSGEYRGDARGFATRRDLDRQSSGQGDVRTNFERSRRGDDNARFERGRQQQQRVERNLQQPLLRQSSERDRQQQPIIHRDRQNQQRGGQERSRVERTPQRQSQERIRAERSPQRQNQERIRVEQDLQRQIQERSRVERSPQRQNQERIRVERDLQRQIQERSRVERSPQRQNQERIRVERDLQRQIQERSRSDRVPREQQSVTPDQQLRQRSDQDRQPRGVVQGERIQQRRTTVFDQQNSGRGERLSSERGRSSRQGSFDSRDRSRGGGGRESGRGDGGRNRR